MRTIDVRIDILRKNVRLGELYAVDAPRLTASQDDSIKMSFSASVLPNEKINWLTDEICPVLIIDGTEHRLGIFAASDVVPSSDRNGAERVRVTAYDRCWRVQTVKWTGARKISAGTEYLEAVESLLIEAGITQTIKVPTSQTIQSDRTWDLGTDYLTICNELLTEINYGELWFNADGYGVIYPVTQPTPAGIRHRLSDGDITSLLMPEMSAATDIYSAPNVFVCICSTPDRDEPLVARSVNDNPASPLSTVSRGREIQSFVRVKEIADLAALQAYAEQLRWESMGMGETVTVRTALRPGHGIGDVVSLVAKDIMGIYVETGWRMELRAGGQMQHTLRRVVYSNG